MCSFWPKFESWYSGHQLTPHKKFDHSRSIGWGNMGDVFKKWMFERKLDFEISRIVCIFSPNTVEISIWMIFSFYFRSSVVLIGLNFNTTLLVIPMYLLNIPHILNVEIFSWLLKVFDGWIYFFSVMLIWFFLHNNMCGNIYNLSEKEIHYNLY